MNKICTRINELEVLLEHNLKPSRYKHSLGVEKMARHLAEMYNEDPLKAAFAGRYHDIAKCYTQEESNRLLREYGLSMDYYNNPQLAHSQIGTAILRVDYGITDNDILMAVSSHTTGRPGMSLLEEIVYVSDAIEINRKYKDVENLRKQALTDLHGTCLFIMNYTIDKLHSEGRPIDNETLSAREYIKNKLR